MHFDVFNGDADGIISLVQLRLAQPMSSQLITGVKRDISLVKNINVSEATSVTILDISMEKNIDALQKLLSHEIEIFYADHHRSGDIPQSPFLNANIDTDPNTCTALIVNKFLNGQYTNWAIAAAYGDNMLSAAESLADKQCLDNNQRDLLKRLGVYVNYNGYGRTVEDLHFTPDSLFKKLVKFDDPLDLVNQKGSVFEQLAIAYDSDMDKAKSSSTLAENSTCKVVELPDEAWARRVSGVFGNELANKQPSKAHAVFTSNIDNTYTVSLRAPLAKKHGAGDICASFETGGGRAAAAGINKLPKEQLTEFVNAVTSYYN